jgi:hypothetical protein
MRNPFQRLVTNLAPVRELSEEDLRLVSGGEGGDGGGDGGADGADGADGNADANSDAGSQSAGACMEGSNCDACCTCGSHSTDTCNS